MPEIQISVTEKIAKVRDAPVIVCGNSDYTIQFTFDSEWDDYEEKTAEFRYWRSGEKKRSEVLFSGDTVSVPILRDIDEVEIGVYAGNLRTSTPARIPCARSITDGDAVHDPPTPDVYNQLMEYLAGIQSGGAQVGNAVPALHGTAMSRIGTPEYPLLQGTIPIVQGGWEGMVGGTIWQYGIERETWGGCRCSSDKLYKIPSGKTATISVSNSDLSIYYRAANEWQIITEVSGWLGNPCTIDNSTGESDMYVGLIYGNDTEPITPSDVGTVMAVLE